MIDSTCSSIARNSRQFVTRVSTERQATTEEGSLKNQLQRLRAHIEYKVGFFEVLNEYGVDLVCLKQNYDTTSPQGKHFITIMMALAQFEREQTSERTRDATAARADRGLWNGGRLVGYDLDADRKGNLVPNEGEVILVNFAFDTYLETGSIKLTTDALNARGYRTKAYTSRRERHHAGVAFTTSSVQYLLKNPAYVAQKEINKSTKMRAKGGYRLVDAVWPAIVTREKFDAVQRLMRANGQSNHNGSAPVRHTYVLSGGILHCGRCSGPVEGRSGTGRFRVKYFYYVCRNNERSLKVTASEVEDAVLSRLSVLAQEDGTLAAIVAETNRRRSKELPSLQARLRSLERKLASIRTSADKVLAEWSAMDAREGRTFLNERLGELAQQREQLEQAVAEAEDAVLRAKACCAGLKSTSGRSCCRYTEGPARPPRKPSHDSHQERKTL